MSAKLFEAARIGTLTLRNRIVMPPMLMGYGDPEGRVTPRMVDYLEERARGGVGMVIVEAVGIRMEGRVFPCSINCFEESHLPGLTELASAIKKHGARAAIQIGDGGRNTRPELTGGARPVAPSPIATHKRDQPHVLTTEEVRDFVMKFANTAALAKRAGFEGIEIHAAHVYFLHQFLSARSNVRTDRYGGSLEKRCQILVEIVEESRKLIGADFPFWVRINGDDAGDENGITIEQAVQIARICERAGYDAISVSCGGSHYEKSMASVYFKPGYLVPYAQEIKKAVKVPVIVVGRLDARLAERIVGEGQADLVAIGRGVMVDPELPRKAQEGRHADIRPCLSCMNCVHRGVLRDTPITCAVNPALGREAEFRLVPAEKKRRVVVVGSGPAGLEAAEVAAARGHEVTLLGAGNELGGEFRLSGAAPQKGPVFTWIEFMRGRLAKLGVTVRLGTEATAPLVAELRPDVVLVATGPLGGPVRSAVATPAAGRVVRLQDVLAGRAEVGASAVILGDDQMAVETADLLSEKGKRVAVVGGGRKLAPSMLNIIRNVLLRKLAEKQVEQLTETRVGAIGPSGVEVFGKDGQRRTLEASTVVLGNDYRVDAGLVSAISASVPAVHLVGGCRLAGDHQDAIHDGFHVARAI